MSRKPRRRAKRGRKRGGQPGHKSTTRKLVPVEQVKESHTGWREADQKAWLWVAATALMTVFLIRRSRGGKVTREMLGQAFEGFVVSDRWSSRR